MRVKTEIVNHKEIDAYKNKFRYFCWDDRFLKMDYMPKKKTISYELPQ